MPTPLHLSSAWAPPAWPLHSPWQSLVMPGNPKSCPCLKPHLRPGLALHGQTLPGRWSLHSITPCRPQEEILAGLEGAGGFSLQQGAEMSAACPAALGASCRFCMAGVPSSADPQRSSPRPLQKGPQTRPQTRTKSPPRGPSALTELGTCLGIARGKRDKEWLF